VRDFCGRFESFVVRKDVLRQPSKRHGHIAKRLEVVDVYVALRLPERIEQPDGRGTLTEIIVQVE
jgi:hypothetical protein